MKLGRTALVFSMLICGCSGGGSGDEDVSSSGDSGDVSYYTGTLTRTESNCVEESSTPWPATSTVDYTIEDSNGSKFISSRPLGKLTPKDGSEGVYEAESTSTIVFCQSIFPQATECYVKDSIIIDLSNPSSPTFELTEEWGNNQVGVVCVQSGRGELSEVESLPDSGRRME